MSLQHNNLRWLPYQLSNTAIINVEARAASGATGLWIFGNLFPEGLLAAADRSVEQFWAYLKDNDQRGDKEPPKEPPENRPSPALSTSDVVPDIEISGFLEDWTSVEGRELVGMFERLLVSVDKHLSDGLWAEDPVAEQLVTANRNMLRLNLYESPDGSIDLAVAGSLGRNLGRALVDAIVPAGDAKQIATNLVSGQDRNNARQQVYDPADGLAGFGEAAGVVPEGENKFEWVVLALGWAADHPVAGVGGTFATIGTTAAVALGVTHARPHGLLKLTVVHYWALNPSDNDAGIDARRVPLAVRIPSPIRRSLLAI